MHAYAGPFTFTSKHNRDLVPTGTFDWTLAFSGGQPVSAMTHPWPLVRGASAKLRLTSAQDKDAYSSADTKNSGV